MPRKPNSDGFGESRPGSNGHGTAVRDYRDELDWERAASMADEGSASGAVMDSAEQAAPPGASRLRWVGLALIAAGCALMAAGVLGASRRGPE